MSVTEQQAYAGDPKLIKALGSNWQEEMEGSITYQTLAGRETDPRRKHILEGLSKAELSHAHLWERRLTEPPCAGSKSVSASMSRSMDGSSKNWATRRASRFCTALWQTRKPIPKR